MSNPLDNMCRTCMLNYAEKSPIDADEIKIVSIFVVPEEAKAENLSLREIMKSTVPQLKIEEDDHLPKNICIRCSEKVIDIYHFQQKSLKVEEQFYKLLEKGNIHDLFNNTKNQEIEMVKSRKSKNNSIESTCVNIENDFSTEDNSNNSDYLIWGENTESNCESNIKNYKIAKRPNKSLKKEISHSSSKRAPKSKKSNSKELYSCDRCQRKLKSKLSLMKHLDMHSKKEREEKELKCNICNQAFQEITMFKNHQRTHISEKTFLCSECGKGFTSAGSLKQHSFRHLDKKLYPCSDCPKSFPTNGDLLCHYEIHKAKPRIHVCEVCGRGFYKPFLLKQHQRYHNGERPYACEFCEKRFITSEKQRRHMRTHTGEKPYRCKYCDRAFAQSNDCIKHLRQHLGDNVYQCELCPLRFPLARDLRVHFASHKDDDDETRSRNLNARIEEERNLQIKFSCQDL